MLNTLRSKQKSILWFLVLIITPAFIIWGAGSGDSGTASPGVVAKINGEKISYSEFYPVYSASYEKMLKFYENYMGVVSKEQKEAIHKQAAAEAVSQLVNNHLLMEYAEKAGITVSAEDIKDVLRQYDVFKTDGVFDESKWTAWLQNTPADKITEIEESFSRDILTRKALTYMRDSIVVSEQEVKDFYLSRNMRLNFTYASADYKDYMGAVPGEEELKAYFEVKQENFREPAKVTVEYVGVSPQQILTDYEVSQKEAETYFDKNKDLYERDEEVNVEYIKVKAGEYTDSVYVSSAEVRKYYNEHKSEFNKGRRIALSYIKINEKDAAGFEITDTDRKSYYEQHKEEYKVKDTARARHILISVNEDMSDKEKDEKMALAKELLNRAKGGEDFAALAKEYSEGPTGSRGGDLGYFERGNMVKAFDDAVFNKMKEGDVYGPVETRYGYHIIKLEDLEPEHYSSLEEDSVATSVDNAITAMKRKSALSEKENEIGNMVKAGARMADIAAAVNGELKKSRLLTQEDFRKQISPDGEFAKMTYAAAKGMVVGPHITGSELLVARIIADEDEYIAPLTAVRGEIEDILKNEKAFEKALKKAERYAESMKTAGVDAFRLKAKEFGAVAFQTGFFQGAYDTFVPGFGYDRNFKRMAFALKYDEVSPPVKVQDGYAVMRLVEKRSGYMPKFSEVKSRVMQDIKLEKAYGDLPKIANTVRKEALGENFAGDTLKRYNIRVQKTMPFHKGNMPAEFSRTVQPQELEKVMERLFEAKEGYVLKPFRAGATYYVMKVTETAESYIRDYADVRPQLITMYMEEKARETAREALKNTAPFTVRAVEASKPYEGLTIDQLKEIAAAADKGSTYVETVNGRIYYVNNIEIDQNVLNEMTESDVKQARITLENSKYESLVMNWIEKRREDSKIAVYID